MKKYKLIKEYPGSPDLGTTVTVGFTFGQMIQDRWCYRIMTSPEFWEEVVEKEYEILSYITFAERIHSSVDEANLYDDKIHSIKRLSDGEIFTIGDRVITSMWIESFKIESFKIENNILKAFLFTTDQKNSHPYLILKEIFIKVKKPLFTTEDGVDIFRGDQYTYVDTKTFRRWETFAGATADEIFYLKDRNLIKFSTKEKAEEYILMNKSCLTIKEICPLFGQTFGTIDDPKALDKLTDKLKELVKSKL